ncbi:MAG: L-arabinose ABC transporter permease AraH [Fimbriimonadaceae bacterium]
MRRFFESAGMAVVLLLLVIGCSIWVPFFTAPLNIQGLLLSVALIGMIATTMLFCLAAGDFDLSVGSTVALSGVLSAVMVKTLGWPVWAAVLAPLGVGMFIGYINGFVIARVGINALITTLATMQIVRGVAMLISKGESIGISNERLISLGDWHYLGLHAHVWYMIALVAIFGFLLNRTVFGRNALAVGGNAEAARLSGVSVTRVKIGIFVLQGLVAAFAGVMLAARSSTGNPNSSLGLELQVISGCVLGGVSLTGGIGTISGVVVGVMIMGIVQNAMTLLSIGEFWQGVVSGTVLLAAVMLDRLKARKQ